MISSKWLLIKTHRDTHARNTFRCDIYHLSPGIADLITRMPFVKGRCRKTICLQWSLCISPSAFNKLISRPHSEISCRLKLFWQSFFFNNGAASNLSSMVATTYAGRRANGDKKRKEILFMDRKEILSAHLVRCCLTVLSEETRAPLPLLEPFWSQGDCECGRLLRARSPIHSLSN